MFLDETPKISSLDVSPPRIQLLQQRRKQSLSHFDKLKIGQKSSAKVCPKVVTNSWSQAIDIKDNLNSVSVSTPRDLFTR